MTSVASGVLRISGLRAFLALFQYSQILWIAVQTPRYFPRYDFEPILSSGDYASASVSRSKRKGRGISTLGTKRSASGKGRR